jgi:thioredoxin-like negative regulator of GroEL
MVGERRFRIPALLALLLASSCVTPRGVVDPDLKAVGERHDALVTSDALEDLIDRGVDSPADRAYAYRVIREEKEESAAYAFARAAVTGRLVQQRGLRAAGLVKEVESWALVSQALDPDFRNGAATRLLGTLYVSAPATFLEHGDSEQGLDLLEQLVEAHPDVIENQLRLAEGYIALGDPDPAVPHLCACLARREELRRDDQRLLDQLVITAGSPDCQDPG